MTDTTMAELAIIRLIGAYPAYVDVADTANIETLFTEDVVFAYADTTINGRDDLVAMLGSAAIGIHLAGVPFVTIDDDGAAASSSVQFFYVKDGSQDVVRGTYRDRLRRDDDGTWRFSKRVIEIRPSA